KPWPAIDESGWLDSEQVADRALEANCRRMQSADRRKPAIRGFEADNSDLEQVFVEQSHMHGTGVRPQAEQREPAAGKMPARRGPRHRRHDDARPRTVRLYAAALELDLGQG